MRQLFLFTLLASELVSCGAQRFLSLDFVKETSPNHPANGNLDKRQESILEPLTNTGTRYIANVSIGTPPQPLPLLLSTGSSEVWMSSSSATFCTDASTANLCLGTFNSSASTTYTPVDNPVFNVTYSSGFGSTGSYFTDQITVGNTTLVSQQMGLANYTTVGRGVLGLGLPDTESLCQDEPCTTSYPTFVDQLVLQGKIITRAYSLYLNDQYAKSGSVLFGAVDVKKYTGDLIALPILPNAQTGVYDSLSVAWTNLTVQSDTKLSAGLVPVNFTAPALIAAGTTYSVSRSAVCTFQCCGLEVFLVHHRLRGKVDLQSHIRDVQQPISKLHFVMQYRRAEYNSQLSIRRLQWSNDPGTARSVTHTALGHFK